MLARRVGVSPPFEKQNQQRVSIRDGLIDVVIIVGTLAESDMDTLAEWLRRRPAKPMGSPRVGSNPTGVACAYEPASHIYPLQPDDV